MMAAFDCEARVKSLRRSFSVLVLVVAGCAYAQTVNLVGYVQDQSGVVLPDADVTVKSGNHLIAHERTDKRGEFSFEAASGSYDFVICEPGFSTLHVMDDEVTPGTPAKFVLRIGKKTAGPIVTPEPPIEIDTTEAHSDAMIAGVRATSVAGSPVSNAAHPMKTAEGHSDAMNAGVQTPSMSGSPVTYAARRDWEFGAFAQGGVGLEDRTNFGFFSLGARAGHMMSGPIGSGVLQGVPEYAVEVLPVWQSYTPKFPQLKCPAGATLASQCYGPVTAGGTYRGVSITPIELRWNFTHGGRLMPWVQAAGGVVYTTRKYPGVGDLNAADATQTGPNADTSVWNFTPQGGIGVHYFTHQRRSVDAAVNAVHISSASLGDKNPGVNVSLMFSVGYTWWK